jgi:hypothetical protein
MNDYQRTLSEIKLRIELEPLSSLMTPKATISWDSIPQEIGVKVRQTHQGPIRPEMKESVDTWFRSGHPFPSGGGVYGTVPNKSFDRVKKLVEIPELRDAVRILKDLDNWLLFWDRYITLRHEASCVLLDALKTTDPEALSRGNEEAGLGIEIRGTRLQRKDTHRFRNDLDFLLDYQWDRAVAFAATQMAELPTGEVFLVSVDDPRIKGTIASRSDVDVQEVAWNGDLLTIVCEAGTRQVGGDGTGALSNSKTERKLSGTSVTERVLKELKPSNVFYPNLHRDKLLEAWATGVDPSTPPYLIGEDIGLVEPLKAGADNLFCRTFVRIGRKVLPEQLSGEGWTQAVYWYFHQVFARRTKGWMLGMGDDLNLVTATDTEEIFHPYVKVKSSKPSTGDKKVLGWWVRTTKDQAIFAVVPRLVKTLSSASKRSTEWEEKLSGQGAKGTIELQVPEGVENQVKEMVNLIKPFLFWKGKRDELKTMLQGLWTTVPGPTLDALRSLKDDIDYRLGTGVETEEV